MTVLRIIAGCNRVAWRHAEILLCATAWMTGLTGCTSEGPTAVTAPQPVSITPKFRAEAGGPQKIQIVEDDPELVHVRVAAEDGSSFYVHRSFVGKMDGSTVLLSASDLLKKPQGEEYYFTLAEIGQIRDKIPGLYMTTTGRRVVAPWKTPQFLHNGEWAWPVYECLKEGCPGRVAGEKCGALFILPDPNFTPDVDFVRLEAERDRVVNTTPPRSREEKLAAAQFLCPHCRTRGRPGPKEAYKQEFRRYRLPESDAMWQELDNEYLTSREMRVRKFGPGPVGPTADSPEQVAPAIINP